MIVKVSFVWIYEWNLLFGRKLVILDFFFFIFLVCRYINWLCKLCVFKEIGVYVCMFCKDDILRFIDLIFYEIE